MADSLLICEKRNATAILTLNRPEKRNALNGALMAELAHALPALDTDESVRVIIITGAGDRAFCAGADLTEVVDRISSAAGREVTQDLSERALTTISKPVIAAINGCAYGFGAQLAVTADIRIASTNAKIRFIAASYGAVVSGSDLPRIVGNAMAKELLFTTRVVEAEEAGRIGLVNRVVLPEQLMPTAIEMAEQIAANSSAAVQWAKRVVDASTTIAEGIAAEAEARMALMGTPDSARRLSEAAERVTGRPAA
jgi:enoyl-CoA hydratase/carnithine racemase